MSVKIPGLMTLVNDTSNPFGLQTQQVQFLQRYLVAPRRSPNYDANSEAQGQ